MFPASSLCRLMRIPCSLSAAPYLVPGPGTLCSLGILVQELGRAAASMELGSPQAGPRWESMRPREGPPRASPAGRGPSSVCPPSGWAVCLTSHDLEQQCVSIPAYCDGVPEIQPPHAPTPRSFYCLIQICQETQAIPCFWPSLPSSSKVVIACYLCGTHGSHTPKAVARVTF